MFLLLGFLWTCVLGDFLDLLIVEYRVVYHSKIVFFCTIITKTH